MRFQLLLVVLYFNSCSQSSAPSTGQVPAPLISDSTCTVSSSYNPNSLIQNINVAVLSSNLSDVSFSLNQTEFEQITSSQVTESCYVSGSELSLVEGYSSSVTEAQYSSLIKVKLWSTIGSSLNFNWQNLNLKPDILYSICLRPSLNTGSYGRIVCSGFLVPDYAPPVAVNCSQLKVNQHFYLGSVSAPTLYCGKQSSVNTQYYNFYDSVNIPIQSWNIYYGNYPSTNNLIGGQYYKIALKQVNNSGYSSVISYKQFYYPKVITISLKFRSKSSSLSSSILCQPQVQTFDNFISSITSNYPGCNLTQNTASIYTLDCSTTQTCINTIGTVCSSLPYVNTASNTCTSNNWNLPEVDQDFTY